MLALQIAPFEVALDIPPRIQTNPRDLARWRANALCEALWGLAHGVRDWEALPTRPHHARVFMTDLNITASVPRPERLTVRVLGLSALGIETHRIVMYRKDYDRVLDDWGYPHLKRVQAAHSRLENKTAPGTKAERAAGELLGLALQAVAAQLPEHARVSAMTWSTYLSSPRLGAIFVYNPQAKGVQLAPRRSGDLRECALALLAACA